MATQAERQEDPDIYRDPSEPTDRRLTEPLRLGEAALVAAMAATTTRVFPMRSTILKEGDPETMVSQVVSGWASCRRTLPDGRTQLTSVLLPGDIIGVSSLIGGSRPESVEARTQMSVQSLSHVQVLRLAAEKPNVALWLLWHQSRENKR